VLRLAPPRSPLAVLSAGQLADLKLHHLPDHHRHRLTQHIRVLRGKHALNRFAGSQTSTFGHRGVSFSSNFAGTTIMSAAVAGNNPNPATSYTTTTDSTVGEPRGAWWSA
jgi:hypothetical protein